MGGTAFLNGAIGVPCDVQHYNEILKFLIVFNYIFIKFATSDFPCELSSLSFILRQVTPVPVLIEWVVYRFGGSYLGGTGAHGLLAGAASQSFGGLHFVYFAEVRI